MTDLYARYLEPNPAHGFPGAWLTNSVPFDGAQRYELAPLRGLAPDGAESENNEMNNIRPVKLADNDELRNTVNEQGRTIASLTAENATQAQRIKELEALLKSPCQYHHLPLINGWSHQITKGVGIGSKKIIRCPLTEEVRKALETK